MITQYCLHRNSVQSQHFTLQQAQDSVRCMLDILESLRPLVLHGLTSVLYDDVIETRSLKRSGESLLSVVNSLSTDFRTRWFTAIKSHAIRSITPDATVHMRNLPHKSFNQQGDVPFEFLAPANIWMSFSGTVLFNSDAIEVSRVGHASVELRNCASQQSMTADWPKFEPSPKHRLKDYDRNGDTVSAMDLTVEDAQAALLVAQEYGGSRYSLVRGKIYRFIATNPGGSPPVFHGFRVDKKMVPHEVFAMLEN